MAITKRAPSDRNDQVFRASRRAPAVKPGRKLRVYPDLATLTPAEMTLARAIAAAHLSRIRKPEPA